MEPKSMTPAQATAGAGAAYREAQARVWSHNTASYHGAGRLPDGITWPTLVVERNASTGEVRAWLAGRRLADPLPVDIAALAPIAGGGVLHNPYAPGA